MTRRRLKVWLERGWVTAVYTEQGVQFSDLDMTRLQLICELQDEMSVDEDFVPTVLSLLDQVYGLRRELRRVMNAVAAQPEPVRSQIIDRMQETKSR